MPTCVRCGKPKGWLYTKCPECLALGDDETSPPLPADSYVVAPSDVAPPANAAFPTKPNAEAPTVAFFAKFPRRLNAMSADTVILVLFSIAVFSLLPLVQQLPAVRLTVVVGWWATLLLYEPISVSLFGGTPGHRLLNLRVVDDRTGRRVGLGKALARFYIKALFGVFSFFTMNFSRHHRAIHDMATGSTVQIRDLGRALPEHYVVDDAPAPFTRAT